MLAPHRESAELTDPLELVELPGGQNWDGKIAYLDRDGVINVGSENYVNSPAEVELLPNAGLAIGNLRRAGYRIVVVTNQSPIGRGHWDSDNLDDIHSELRNRLLIEDSDAHLDLILFSPYAPWEGAWARKPNSGMLEAGRQLVDNHPDVGAVVLECTNMGPYASELRRELGIPVFSGISFINWFQSGLLPPLYSGTTTDPREPAG